MIKRCIFDFSGTIADKYSLVGKLSLQDAFLLRNIKLSSDILNKNIEYGVNLDNIFQDEIVSKQYRENFNKHPLEKDKNKILKDLVEIQKINADNYCEIIPNTLRCFRELKKNDINIDILTRFNIDLTKELLFKFNLDVDNTYTYNNPNINLTNFVLKNNLNKINCLKISDNRRGIQEGIESGCWTVGVARWSQYMDVHTYNEANLMDRLIHTGSSSENYHLLRHKLNLTTNKLNSINPHFVIKTLGELPEIIDKINFKIKKINNNNNNSY